MQNYYITLFQFRGFISYKNMEICDRYSGPAFNVIEEDDVYDDLDILSSVLH